VYLAKTSGNLNPRGQQPQQNLQSTTIRSFEGGLNVTDTDLNMSPKFAKVLDNLERAIDGSLQLRPGTKLLSNQLTDTSNIINCAYFVGYVVVVQASGRVSRVSAAGVVTGMPIGNSGSNPAWTAGSVEVNFTLFNSDLLIANGRDKPLIIAGNTTDPNFLINQFLVDKASGTNVNTPVGKYIISHGQYTIIAGVPTNPSTIYISAKNTSGTYPGDAAPNDAIALNLGSRVSIGSATITGLVAYRDKLIVTFERGVLPMNLGIYTGSPSVHTPTDDGFIEEFGCLAHRSLVSVGDDIFYCDNVGVNSINRVNIFNTLRPVRASHLIDPLITALIQPLTQAQISQYVFAVYDLRNFKYMLFIPQFAADGVTLVETIGFSYINIPALKVQAWARLRGWKWQASCRTALQNVVFAQGNKLYVYDFDNPTGNADFLNDPVINGGAGVAVNFEWEMPWADMRRRMDIKFTRYLGLDTQGDAAFTVESYVDNIVTRQGVRTPLLSANFIGGGSEGYGDQPYGDGAFGGGRRTSEERLFAWVAKFKLLKMRIFGSTTRKLKFVSISIAYIHGGIRR
jgi:hypothetical protein